MSEKPKSVFNGIWEKSWNEPRHFFFWLVLLCPLVFILLVLMTGLTGTPPPLVPWLALSTILGFVLGLPAFVLSWIPPVRRVFTRMLQHKLFVVACLLTLVALFYAEENWRGRNAWNSFRREWEARGVQFDWASIIPPTVPDEQNFFMSPPWEGLRFSKTNNAVVWQDPDAQTKPILDYGGPNGGEMPRAGDLLTATGIDLADWQDFYRGSNNLFTADGKTFTNYFPVSASPQTPAKDILLALTKSGSVLQQLREAARRPHARFWLNYEDGFSMLLPHLAKMKGIAQYLHLRATALLADGQTDAAFDDVMLAFRLNDTIRDEPILISQLVRIAAMQINLSSIWEGLADHRWTDAQLVAFERELARADFLADYQAGMSGERVCSIWTMDFIRRAGGLDYVGGLPETEDKGYGGLMENAVGKVLFGLVPTGWFDQNKFSLGRMHVEFIRPLVDNEKQLVSPANSRRTAAAIEAGALHRTPYNLFTGMLLPALEKAAKKFALAQTCVNLARVAGALERHRLAHGSYPETLDSLAPQFIAKLPHDVIDGQPLKYRRNADGSFILYSVGWNETDDGGTIVMGKGKTPRVDQDEGDWVWHHPAR
jgi:hypothetical protein